MRRARWRAAARLLRAARHYVRQIDEGVDVRIADVHLSVEAIHFVSTERALRGRR